MTYLYPPENDDGFSPLHIAASNKDIVGLKALLDQSQDCINSRDPWEHTPLQIAVQLNDLPAVQLLLSHGADPDLPVPDNYSYLVDGSSSLSLAATCGHVKVCQLLVENSARVTSKPLYMAAEFGMLECVEFLLLWFAKKEGTLCDDGVAKTKAIGTALQIAAGGWRSEIVEVILRDREIERRLLDRALSWSIVDEDEHYDDFHVKNSVPRKTPVGIGKRISTVKLLLDAGADLDANTEFLGLQRMTLLHQVAVLGSRGKEIFDLFLEKEPEINPEDEDGQTPLFPAVLADDVYFAEKLIERGAKVDHTNKEGRTVLQISTGNLSSACKPIVSLLLDHGADISALTQAGETILHLAAHHGNPAAMEIFTRYLNAPMLSARTPTGFTPLHCAVNGYNAPPCIAVVKFLLSQGADINGPTNGGRTILHLAVTSSLIDKIDLISFLLEHGADVNGYTHKVLAKSETPKTEIVDSPLHLTLDILDTHRTDFNIIHLLLEKSAALETRDSTGKTALLRCVIGRETTPLRRRVVRELVRRGAHTEAVDNRGSGFDADVWCVEEVVRAFVVDRGRGRGRERGRGVGLSAVGGLGED
ncbi:Ankyrin repeat-containing protein [Glarea lozoyensis ATCC 20868]|uniref:Ankyrin repeat-containing protein n=1 Tax=Glarea lozoyensis (strain ATCC 20868 / MF5171) TaxID=1116229 RepID=S3D2W8_GLAL2|nr:Ankyrin repeat-containing protein [Glarea lozoyensis ATCC 20868]EPE32827.1 Ankyrin repeat-containing protein [Glarea lozoyensis ATCC 20868]